MKGTLYKDGREGVMGNGGQCTGREHTWSEGPEVRYVGTWRDLVRTARSERSEGPGTPHYMGP